MKYILSSLLLLFNLNLFAQDTITISKDLMLVKLSDRAYIHTSFTDSENWGRFSSNGLIFVENKEAFLFDTPMSDSVTLDLLSWIQDSMQIKLVGFVPNHWHNDCTEGMDLLQQGNIPTYALKRTNQILKKKQLPIAKHTFQKSTTLQLGKQKIICDYLGKGHTDDNIVTWLPSEKILFAGCMCKAAGSKSLGNTADANLKEWPVTIKKVLDKYKNAAIVIPGHGNYGKTELLKHTLFLLEQAD